MPEGAPVQVTKEDIRDSTAFLEMVNEIVDVETAAIRIQCEREIQEIRQSTPLTYGRMDGAERWGWVAAGAVGVLFIEGLAGLVIAASAGWLS